MPFPLMPGYGASKAGVHAYTVALRAQLAGTGVQVTELVPPAVATAGQEKVNPAALPLEGYLDEVVGLLTQEPQPQEIVVEKAQYLRWAERDGTYAELLERRSQALGGSRDAEDVTGPGPVGSAARRTLSGTPHVRVRSQSDSASR